MVNGALRTVTRGQRVQRWLGGVSKEEDRADPEGQVLQDELRERVVDAIRVLPPKQRAVLEVLHGPGLKPQSRLRWARLGASGSNVTVMSPDYLPEGLTIRELTDIARRPAALPGQRLSRCGLTWAERKR